MGTKSDNLTKRELDARIKRRIKAAKQPSVMMFFKRILTASALLELAVDGTTDSGICSSARKNFITNVITSLEIFFQDLIIENRGYWPTENFDSLLKEKITLREALNFRMGTKLDPEHIIAAAHPFNSPNAINHVFTSLLGRDFWNCLKVFQFHQGNEITRPQITIDDLVADWKGKLYQLYDLRNAIVHEDYSRPITKRYIQDVHQLMYAIVEVVPAFLGSQFNYQKMQISFSLNK